MSDNLHAPDVQALQPLQFPLWGSRLIEASAGTGKTYTIAALYLRLVLQHGGENAYPRALVPPDILVVTFTDAATQELRDRIRHRLAEAAELFGHPVSSVQGLEQVDPLLLALRADYAPDRWPGCARLLSEAANWMDEAAVSTIHSWCYRMLREHAFDSGALFQQQLVTDQTELLTQVVQDYWRQQFYGLPATSLETLLDVVKSPADLQAALQSMLTRQDADWRFDGEALPDGAQVDVAALLGQAAQEAEKASVLQDAARALWSQHQAVIEKLLVDALPYMNGTSYPKKDEAGVFEGWLADMAAWSMGADAPGIIKRFSQSGIKLKKGGVVPEHAAFAALDEWQEVAVNSAPDKNYLKALLLSHALTHVAQALELEKQRRAELGFDDLLKRLDVALQSAGGDALAQRIRTQFPVAMIDEFQDTDPLQYRIFERIYRIQDNEPSHGLFMIGDPKQAIYAFRGADIYTYLRARSATQGRHYSLGTNYRSTTEVVDAVNYCFNHSEMHGRGAFRFRADESRNPVPFVPVAAHGRKDRLFIHGEPTPALNLWALQGCSDPEHGTVWGASNGTGVPEAAYRRYMAEVAATQITDWLNAAHQGRAGFAATAADAVKPLRPADIAILVRGRSEADAMRTALAARQLASVYLSDRESVFQSEEAADVLRWLCAVHEPGNDSLLRAALATTSMGWSWAELDRLNHDERYWDELVMGLRSLQQLWQYKGVLPMLRQWLVTFSLPARWLAAHGGERRLTNVLHLAEWLQRASVDVEGEQALMRYLNEQMQRPEGEEEILRLESDADLIKIVTIHKSKGLEYPLVLLPFASSYRDFNGRSQGYAQYHDADGALVVELSAKQKTAVAEHNDERLSEDMRLLYVALTRAQYALWLGVAPIMKGVSKSGSLEKSAIGYLLGGGATLPDLAFEAYLQDFSQGCSHIAAAMAPEPTLALYQPLALPTLYPPRTPQRAFDEHWWIASFSALTEKLGAVTQPIATEFEVQVLDSRAVEPETAQEDQFLEPLDRTQDQAGARAQAAPGSVHAFPKGPDAGNFLHSLLEWSAQEGFAQTLAKPAALDGIIAHRCKVRGWADWAEPLQGFMRQWLQAPLHLLGAPASLATLTDYQVEMEFWLSIDHAWSDKLDALVQRHIAPGRVRPKLASNQLNGMLKGYMDLVLEHEGRYYVADYKSNWLGVDSSAYTEDAMLAAVLQHRYEVQYVLYTYALHRLLQQRLPGYDYDRDVGGVRYWFLRGVDADNHGMYTGKPARALIDALDVLFAPKAQ